MTKVEDEWGKNKSKSIIDTTTTTGTSRRVCTVLEQVARDLQF